MGALGSTAACTRPGRQDGRGLASAFALDACVATPDGGASGCGDLGRRSVVGAALVPARSKRFGHGGERGGLGALPGRSRSSPKRTCINVFHNRTLDRTHFLRHTFWSKQSNMEAKRSAGSSMLDVARCGTCLRTLNFPAAPVALSATTRFAVTGVVCVHSEMDPSSLDRVGVGIETRAPCRSVALRMKAADDETAERLRQQRQRVHGRGTQTMGHNERRNHSSM